MKTTPATESEAIKKSARRPWRRRGEADAENIPAAATCRSMLPPHRGRQRHEARFEPIAALTRKAEAMMPRRELQRAEGARSARPPSYVTYSSFVQRAAPRGALPPFAYAAAPRARRTRRHARASSLVEVPPLIVYAPCHHPLQAVVPSRASPHVSPIDRHAHARYRQQPGDISRVPSLFRPMPRFLFHFSPPLIRSSASRLLMSFIFRQAVTRCRGVCDVAVDMNMPPPARYAAAATLAIFRRYAYAF